MGWILAIAILVLLVVSAGFRKFTGVVIAIGAAIGLYFYLQNEREEAASLERIPSSALKIDGLLLHPSYSGYTLTGRVTNASRQYTLTQLSLKITMNDCTGEPPQQSCITIAETTESMYLQIPPGQARDLNESIYFTGGQPKARGKLEWNFRIEEIRGR